MSSSVPAAFCGFGERFLLCLADGRGARATFGAGGIAGTTAAKGRGAAGSLGTVTVPRSGMAGMVGDTVVVAGNELGVVSFAGTALGETTSGAMACEPEPTETAAGA